MTSFTQDNSILLSSQSAKNPATVKASVASSGIQWIGYFCWRLSPK